MKEKWDTAGKPPAQCFPMNDSSQQNKRAEEPPGQSIDSWDIIHRCFKALTFGIACYTAVDKWNGC